MGRGGGQSRETGGLGVLVQVGPDPGASLPGDLRACADRVRLPG